jgi:sigma-E factor negative regulatory protein RseA
MMVVAMDDKLKEKLSAFMDGELNDAEAAEVYQQLQHDDELKASWSRFHLIRDALKYEVSGLKNDELASRVSAALEDEPVVMAPKRRRGQVHQFTRHVASFAVAASLTAVAILGIQQYTSTPETSEFQVASKVEKQQWKRVSGTHWSLNQPEVEDRLNAYLVKHNEYASGNTSGSMLPYVTIVGYGKGTEDSQQQ